MIEKQKERIERKDAIIVIYLLELSSWFNFVSS